MPGRSSGPGGRDMPAVRQVDPRTVRQQRVLHPEGRPPARPDRADEALEALGAAALQVRDDRRAASRGSDAAVARAGTSRWPPRTARSGSRACPSAVKIECGWSRTVGDGARPRRDPVEDQRHRLGGRVVRGLRVAEPGAVARQRGEVRDSGRRRSSRSGPSRMSPPNSSKTISTTFGCAGFGVGGAPCASSPVNEQPRQRTRPRATSAPRPARRRHSRDPRSAGC